MKESNKIIVPTGYMGSGSSVITDLLSEVDGIDVSRGTFEYVFLHCPNGVFDLEDKLLIGNNAIRSDEALHSFLNTMKQLYDKKYWWVGHYNENIGKDFYSRTCKYVDDLAEFKTDYYWYYQENVNYKMVPRLVLNKVIKLLTGGKKRGKKPLLYPEMWISFTTPEKFYALSKDYIRDVLNMAGADKGSIVFDQLLLPFNLKRFDNYFDDNTEVFVVERDPRDVFISNKYYWPNMNESVPYPTDVDEFCEYYKKLRAMEDIPSNNHIHRVKFEDFIYNYDETVKHVFEILGISSEKHVRVKDKFKPEKSINNTQLFLKDKKYKDECDIIAYKLKDYLYDFPYSIDNGTKEVF